jgi:hypothetical protein
VLAAGALLAGCTAESHENEPRPPLAQVISVAVSDEGIEVAPRVVDFPGQLPLNINQNANAPVSQSDPDQGAVVNFRISNQTRRNAPLVLEGPVEQVVRMTPSAPTQFQTALEPGIYRLSSPASAGTGRFVVGRSRISSANDVLTP